MNNKSYPKGKSNSDFIIKNVLFGKFILIILFMFILSSISVFAATNISILYAFDGTQNVPIQVDAAGRLYFLLIFSFVLSKLWPRLYVETAFNMDFNV